MHFAALIIIVPDPCPHGLIHVGMDFSKHMKTVDPEKSDDVAVKPRHVGVHRKKLWLKRLRLAGVITPRSRRRRRTIQNGAHVNCHFSPQAALNTSAKYRQDATKMLHDTQYDGGVHWWFNL